MTLASIYVQSSRLVRDQAFKALELFVKKLEEYVSHMVPTSIPPCL